MQTLKQKYCAKKKHSLHKKIIAENLKITKKDISFIKESFLLSEGGPSKETLQRAIKIIAKLQKIANIAQIQPLEDSIKIIRQKINRSFGSAGSLQNFLKSISDSIKKAAKIPNVEENPIAFAMKFAEVLVDGFSKLNDVVEMHTGNITAEADKNDSSSIQSKESPQVQTIGSAIIAADPKYKGKLENLMTSLFELDTFTSIIKNKKDFIKSLLNIPLERIPEIHKNIAEISEEISSVENAMQQPSEQSADVVQMDDESLKKLQSSTKELVNNLKNNNKNIQFSDSLEDEIQNLLTKNIINVNQATQVVQNQPQPKKLPLRRLSQNRARNVRGE